jgi:hypothetical protein
MDDTTPTPIMTKFGDGSKRWNLLNGDLHREDGPAIETDGGSKFWLLYGKRHRTDGPAVDRADGTKWWYLEGKIHRADGPALVRPDGDKQWWWNDVHLSLNEWLDRNTDMTDEEKVMYKLQYG